MVMMCKKAALDKTQIEMLSLDQLVPEDHLVRKLDSAIDLSFIYGMVEHLYSPLGAESIDPVVLIKLNILQLVFGIRSMRQTIKEIEVNTAYRWYIGYGMTEKVPHFSTFSKNYSRRFEGTDLFEQLFKRVLEEIIKHGFLEEENVFIDGTHVKASANNHKSEPKQVEKTAKYYEAELKREINADREAHGKKPLKEPSPEEASEVEMKEIKSSTTDPDCGVFHKGEHKKVFAYSANVACDEHGYIMGYEIDAGNAHDSTVFPKLYKQLQGDYQGMQNIVVDAGYKTPAIAREIIESGKTPVMPYKRPMTKDGFFKKYEYVYDEHFDCYICPGNAVLKYTTTNREGYREYKSDPAVCAACPNLQKCTHSKTHTKVVMRHIWEPYIEQAEDIRQTKGTKEIYDKRKETIERVFADAKELHGMRYVKHRGLSRVKMELSLLFMCMNLKKLANRLWKTTVTKVCLLLEPFFLRVTHLLLAD
jgi:transposase